MSATLTANQTAGTAFEAITAAVTAAQAENGTASDDLFAAWTLTGRTVSQTAAAHLASDEAEVGQTVHTANGGEMVIARASGLFGMLLSADGETFSTEAWCTCGHDGDSVYVERWAFRGEMRQEFHGYVCPSCRHLTQTG